MGAKERVIVFRLDADHERGMGHLFRMITLADKFREKGFACIFLLRENKAAGDVLKKTPFAKVFYASGESEQTIVDSYFRERIAPVLWIFDILSTKAELVEHVKGKVVPVVCFDDLEGGPISADLVINAITGCWEEGERLMRSHEHVLGGPKYAIIDPRILGLQKKGGLSSETLKVAVTLGGSDTHGATVKVAQVLSGSKGIQVMFFLGPHFIHDGELKAILSEVTFPYSIKKAVPELHREIAGADIAICGGGQTLFELCAMGMAVMALANEKHEEKTISYFSRYGGCIDIGSVHGGIRVEKIRDFLKKAGSEDDEIVRLRANAQRLVDGVGVSRCYDECARLMKQKND